MNHPKQKIKFKHPKILWVISVLLLLLLIFEIIIFIVIPYRGVVAKNLSLHGLIKQTTISMSSVTAQPDDKSAKPLPGFKSDYVIPAIQDGMVPVITNIATKQNVVFLGIDDGAFKDQSVVDIIKQNGIKATLFLSKAFISGDPTFFKQITALGSLVEDHTLGHDTNMVTTQGYEQQKNEICGMADYIEAQYGRRPIFFRPPGGAYSSTMRRAAADCGMKAIITWIAKANGGAMQYQIGNKLRPGDIVLMHFRPEFKQDMQAFVDAENAAGLHTELLEDLL